MKKYYRYKDFVPLEFVEKNKTKEIKGNEKAIFILIILNLYLLPNNLNLLFKIMNKPEYNQVKEVNTYIEYNQVFKWVNLYDNFPEFKVEDGVCEIILNKYNDLKKLEELNVKVNKFKKEEEKIIIEVEYE